MPNIKISDLPDVVLPLDAANVFLEVQAFAAGEPVSRKIAAQDLSSSFGLDATFVTQSANAILPNERILTAGTNISVIDGGAGGPITINVVGLVTTLAGLSDVDLTGQATGDLLFNVDGTNWEDTGGDLTIDIGNFRFISNYTIQANGGIALVNANGEVFLDNVFLGGGLFQYSIAVGGNDAVTLRDNGLAQFGMSGGTETTTLISGVEVRLVRGGLDEIALSLAPAAGGLSVNNALTGAGLERVLTESDASVAAIFQYAWLFDTSTTQADPGTNTLRFNNVTPANITFIYIDDTGPDGQDLGSLIVSNFTDGYQFEAADPTDADTLQRFLVTGPPVDFTGFWRIPVVNLSAQSGASLPANGADIQVVFDFHQFIDQGTLTANSKDMLFWDGNAWNNTGSTTRINPNRPAIGGAFSLTGSGSVDRTTPMMFVSIGNSVSTLWFMQGGIVGDGGYCFGDFTGPDLVSWGWDLSGVATDLFSIDENLRVTINAAAGFVFAEKAADHGNIAGFGEIWVRNDVPNVLVFTDDTGADTVLGGGFDPSANQTITGDWTFDNAVFDLKLGVSTAIHFRNPSDNSATFVQNLGPTLQWGIAGADFGSGVFEIAQSSFAHVLSPPIFIGEQAAAEGDIAGDGQFWVRNDIPNTPMFTDDVGTDFVLNAVSIPIVLLDNEQIQFGTAQDVTMDWDGVDFEVESLAASQIWNWRDGLRHRWYDPTDAQYIEIEAVSATVFNINLSNASAGLLFIGANFYRFDDVVQADGFVTDDAIASFITFEVAGIERASWTCFPTSLTLSLNQSSGDIYTIANGINSMSSLEETGGLTIFEDGAADTDFVNLKHTGTNGQLNSNLGSLQMLTAGVIRMFFTDPTVTGRTTAATIQDNGSVSHEVGYNDLQIFNDNVSDTLESRHAGQIAFKDATTARTLTLASNVDLDFPVEHMTTVINAFTSGDYTITEGASTTLFYLDGATRIDTAGGAIVGPGGVANIWRESATVYYIWGTGITP